MESNILRMLQNDIYFFIIINDSIWEIKLNKKFSKTNFFKM